MAITNDIGNNQPIDKNRSHFYLDVSPTPVFIANSKGEYVYVNKAAGLLLGYTTDELTKLSIFDIANNLDNKYQSKWEQVNKKGHLMDTELDLVTKNGQRVTVLLDSVKISDDEIIGFAVNITDRKISEEKYRSIISTSIDGFSIVNKEGKFIEVNDAYAEMIGYSSTELISGMGLNDVEAKEDSIEISKHINKIIEIGSDRFISKQRCKSGKIIDIEISTTFIPSQKHFIVFSRDITEQQKRKNQLIQSEILLSQAQHIANMGHYNLDFGKGEWNSSEALDNIFEIDPSYNKTIKGWLKLIHPDHIEEMQSHLNDHVIKNKKPFNKQYKIIGQETGKIKWVHGKGELIYSEDGNPITMFGVIQDITKQKLVEEELRENNLRFALAVESAGIAVWDWDVQNNILSWDDKMHELYDIDKNKFEGAYAAWTSALHKDDKDRLMNEINLALNGEKEYNTEFKINVKDGKVKYLRAFAKTLKDENGSATRMIGINYDITELKKAQQQIIASEQRFKTIFDDSLAVMFIINPEIMKIIDVNKTAEKYYGYSKEEFTKLKVTDLNLSSVEKINRDMESTVRNKGGRFEFKHRLSNGEIRDVEVYSSPITIDGKLHLNSIVHDITERKKVEKDLIKSEERYRNFFEHDLTGDYLTTVEGKIVDCNNALVKILGYDSREELLGVHSSELYPEKSNRDGFLKLMKNQKVLTDHEIKLKKKDGTIIHCLENCIGIFDDEGRLLNLQGYLFDITEEKIAEDKLKKNEQEKTSILNSTLSGLYIYNFVDRQYEYINPAYTAVVGWSIDELNAMGDKFFDLFHPDDFEKVHSHFTKLTESKLDDVLVIEYRFKSKNGKWLWLLSYDRVYERDETGKITKFIGSFVDNSTQKEVELALRESEERFRLIFDNIHSIAVQGYNHDGIVHYWNKASENLYGYSRSEAIGKYLWDLIIPIEMKEEVKKAIKFMFESEKPIPSEELWLKRKDGSLVPVYSNHTIVNVLGKQKELYCIDIDLTERKKTEKELKFQARLLQEIGESVIGTNSEGEIIYWNHAAELLYGWKEEEVLGKSIIDVTPSNQSAEASEEVMKELIAGKRWSGEMQLKKKNGETFDAFVTDSPFSDENENLIGIIGVSKDITELKKVEKDLRSRNEFIQTVLDNLPIGIALNKINDGRAQYMNKKFEEIYGWPEEEMEEIPEFFERIYPDVEYREQLVSRIMSDIKTGDPSKMHWENIEIRTKDNVAKKVNAQNIPLFEQNTMVSTVLDVTAEKNAEKILVESQRLSAIGEMSSAIAHDFNNSLQSILGNIDLSLIQLNENHPSRRYLETIKVATTDAAARVRLLQRFAGKSKSKDAFTSLDVNQMIEDVIQQSRPMWKDSKEKDGIHFEVKTELKDVKRVHGNEGELKSVLYNSIKNSVEAMPNGGNITIKTYHKNGNVKILIVDEGIGMDEKTKARIFQPFFSTKGFESGRGLGMSGAYTIIKEHNGNIYIKDSSPNKGTSLAIELPAIIEKEKNKISEKVSSKYEGTANILWVDDDEMIREVAKEMLSVIGHKGKVVASGPEAIEELKNEKYDLLVTDIGMPGMNGWELISKIKSNPDNKLKIAVLTGWGDQIGDEEKNKHQIQHIISKPFKIDQLNSIIGSILSED